MAISPWTHAWVGEQSKRTIFGLSWRLTVVTQILPHHKSTFFFVFSLACDLRDCIHMPGMLYKMSAYLNNSVLSQSVILILKPSTRLSR